ncbi:MAG: LysR family transcriptional regulator [Candidatus Bathyarchaeota archaeon]|nr:MAG: LysR family transcriptional regulator [Candidatus Bathyarchaeota archaeon]
MWLETDEGFVFGPGVYSLLKKVEETGTLKRAAQSLEMSYRYAWGLVKKAEKKLGEPLLLGHKGGRAGGGGTELTEIGREFLEDFSKMKALMDELSNDPGLLQGIISRDHVEAELTEMRGVGNGAEAVLTVRDHPQFIVNVSKAMLDEKGVEEGDTVILRLTTLIGSITKD